MHCSKVEHSLFPCSNCFLFYCMSSRTRDGSTFSHSICCLFCHRSCPKEASHGGIHSFVVCYTGQIMNKRIRKSPSSVDVSLMSWTRVSTVSNARCLLLIMARTEPVAENWLLLHSLFCVCLDQCFSSLWKVISIQFLVKWPCP